MSRPTTESVMSCVPNACRGATASTKSIASPILSHGAPTGAASSVHRRALGHGVRVAGVVERVVDEHADVVDDGDRLVDDGVLAAEELERERVEVDRVARAAPTITS